MRLKGRNSHKTWVSETIEFESAIIIIDNNNLIPMYAAGDIVNGDETWASSSICSSG